MFYGVKPHQKAAALQVELARHLHLLKLLPEFMEAANVRTRPLRLAFLVEARDKKCLMEVIEINSALWGGIYVPAILRSMWSPPSLSKR